DVRNASRRIVVESRLRLQHGLVFVADGQRMVLGVSVQGNYVTVVLEGNQALLAGAPVENDKLTRLLLLLLKDQPVAENLDPVQKRTWPVRDDFLPSSFAREMERTFHESEVLCLPVRDNEKAVAAVPNLVIVFSFARLEDPEFSQRLRSIEKPHFRAERAAGHDEEMLFGQR